MNTDFWGAIAILVLLFLVGREFICWYFKINHRLDLLEEIRDLLKDKEEIIVKTEKKSSTKKAIGEISIVNSDDKV